MTGTHKRRLTQDETHDLLVQAGLEALHDAGLGVGLEAVNLEAAIRGAGVARASAYRLWPATDDHGPQELFQREVLAEAIRVRDETVAATAEALGEAMGSARPDCPPRDLFRELVRVGARSNLETVRSSPPWKVVSALHAVVSAQPTTMNDLELVSLLSEAEEQWRAQTEVEFYRPWQELFDLRPKAPFGDDAMQLLIIAANALVEGLVAKEATEGASAYIDREYELDDGSRWTMFALLFDAIVSVFFDAPWDDTSVGQAGETEGKAPS